MCAAGYYWDPFPDVALASSVEKIRDAMIAEIESGADGTGIRCGVIKVGTAREPNEPAERLFRAAAAAVAGDRRAGDHAHVEPDQAGWHIRVLEDAGMDMTHAVISHMGAAKDVSELVEVGRCGAFMGIDKVSFPKGPTNVELADLVRDACDKGLERQLILSSDVARRTHALALRRQGLSDGAPRLRADAGGARHRRDDDRDHAPDNPARMLTFAK